jgi:hypothetical protein
MEILENIKIEPLDPTVTIPTKLPGLHRGNFLRWNSRAPFGTDCNKFSAEVKREKPRCSACVLQLTKQLNTGKNADGRDEQF